MLSTPVDHNFSTDCWRLTTMAEGWHQVDFTEGTMVTGEIVSEISQQLGLLKQDDPINLVVIMSGVTDVAPQASTELAAAPPSTRIALLGANDVDQVLAGFLMYDLKIPELAKYVTSVEDALEHFKNV